MKSSLRFSLKFILLVLFSNQLNLFSVTAAAGDAGIHLPAPDGTVLRAVLLQPADSIINGLPLLKVMDKADTVAKIVYGLFRDSYMRKAVGYYYLVQNYLVCEGKIRQAEPAYLLLSQTQGGFPRYGFYLANGDSILDKSEVPYIELVKNKPDPENELGSMTQIYPHEMGHVLYRLLSEDSDSLIPGGVDIHYSTLTTDYGTAFNEGFAMHFENMARTFDPDEDRKAAIVADYSEKKKNIRHKISAFERDFTWPLRLGFYRLSMLLWYQHFEDIKRFEWVQDNRMKYANATEVFNDPEKSLFFRNSGIRHTSSIRPVQQALATEGVIASFYFGLMQSEAKSIYRENEFYAQFLPDCDTSGSALLNSIDPIDNQYMKIFEVLHHHVHRSISIHSQLLDFVSAYIMLNPEEEAIVKSVFHEATGLDYPLDPGREIWITNPDHEHCILVMDQTGGLSVPYYTFNLNAATEADLLTFDGISKQDAKQIMHHIRQSGPLNYIDELKEIPMLDERPIELLEKNRFDAAFFESFDDGGLSLSINTLLISYLKHFLLMVFFYGLLAIIPCLLILHLLSAPLKKSGFLWLPLRFLLLLLTALVVLVLTPLPAVWFAGFSLLFIFGGWILQKKSEKRKQFLYTSLVMAVVLLYALI